MAGRWLRRAMALVALALTLACAESAQAQDAGELVALRGELSRLHNQGKYAEALPIAERYVALAQKRHGEAHPEFATAIGWMGDVLVAQGRYVEAEPLFKRALTIIEKALGPDHREVGTSLSNLAALYDDQGRFTEAAPLLKRALVITERALGPDHPEVGTTLGNLAAVYERQGLFAEAEPLHQRALAITERALGPSHPSVGIRLNNLAALYRAQGRYVEAEPLYKRALAIIERGLGPDHPSVGASLNNLAALYDDQGRLTEAEPLLKRALLLTERALGPDHPEVGIRLNNLAELYRAHGHYVEAEPLYKRALVIAETALGAAHPDVAIRLSNLAGLYSAQSRYTEAEPLYKTSLAITERALGPDYPEVGASLNNLAALYERQGRATDAEPLFKRSLAIREKALGPDHPDVGQSLNNLAVLYDRQGRSTDAELLYKRSLAIREKALGPDHPDVSQSLNNLAVLSFVQGDWARAADFWRRSTDMIVRRAQRGTDDVGQGLTGKRKSEAERESAQWWSFAKVAHRLAEQRDGSHQELSGEMFKMAQWAVGSEAAASLAQMAARGAKGDPGLGLLVRERQDLVAEWQKRDGMHSAAVSQAPDRRDRPAEATNVARLAVIDARIADIDKRLAADFPDYADLSRPKPLSVEDVQSQLRPDEALVLFLDTPQAKPTPEETFIWVITNTHLRWVRSPMGTPALTREVSALRCGLDAAAWDGEGAAKCLRLLDIAQDTIPKGHVPLPFDLSRAHALYKALFGQVEDLIRDKHLLIVPSGPLTSITVLPAASSLKALRRVARASAAKKPMIGFGNPLLDGDPAERPWEADWAKLARQKQVCQQTPWQQIASAAEKRRSVLPAATHGGHPDLDHLRSQMPLHDTADELCAVAKALKLAPDDIILGANATEATIKRLSAEGRLANYRVLHFATHGTLSGEISGTTEPGLILTPPAEQTENDDGYLSASEVAVLKLDADWVILSACNTAAGGAAGAEALSGLARAFIYAGARAMLVSHWAVDSAATVKLITHAVGATGDNTVGRAEALRRAMLAMIDSGEAREAHPRFWAPFVVVGEGAAAK